MMFQPTDADVADMFRVMMTEMLKMHPTWQTVVYRLEDLRNAFDRPNIKKKDLRHFIERLERVVQEMKD